MFKFVLIVLFLKVVNSDLILPKRDNSVKNCVKKIMEEWIDEDTTVVYVYYSDSRDVLPDSMSNPVINFNANGTKLHLNGYKTYKELIVININNIYLLEHAVKNFILSGIQKVQGTLGRKYLIICQMKNLGKVGVIFNYLSVKYSLDVIVLIVNGNSHNIVITRDYHEGNDCGKVTKNVEAETCETIIIPKTNLLKKYSNCTVAIISESHALKQKHDSELGYINFRFMNMFIKTFNVTAIQIYKPGTKKYFFNLGMLRLGSCSITSLYMCTFPLYVDTWAWIVPSPKQINPLEVFKIIFKKVMWISIFLSFFIVTVVWWLIQRCERAVSFTRILLDVYSITLLGYIHKISSFPALRILFVTYVIYSIHIQSIFTSNLVRLLTVPQYERALETVEEIALSSIPVKIQWDLLKYKFNHEENDTLYSKIKHKSVSASPFDPTFDNCSILLPKYILPLVANHHQQKFQVVIDDAILGPEFISYATLSNIFLPSLNNFVNILIESGIIDYERRYYQAFMNNISHLYDNQLNVTDEKVVITLEHVYPVFVFWGAGLCVATMVFFGEVLTYVISNKLKKRN